MNEALTRPHIVGIGSGYARQVLVDMQLALQDAEILQDPILHLEVAGGTGVRPLYEAMAANGTPEQIVAFVKMQREIGEVKDSVRLSGPRVCLDKQYYLASGPVLRAIHRTHSGEEGMVDWDDIQSWDYQTLHWPGLSEAVKVYDSLRYVNGGDGHNFPSIDGQGRYDKALMNIGLVSDALAKKGESRKANKLVLDVVGKMDLDAKSLEEAWRYWRDLRIKETDVRSKLIAVVRKGQR